MSTIALVALVATTMMLLFHHVEGQALYGFVVDGSGDPTTSNFYSFGTDGTSSATNVAALSNTVVAKASTTDSASQLYWTAFSAYPANGLLAIDVSSGDVVTNLTLSSAESLSIRAPLYHNECF